MKSLPSIQNWNPWHGALSRLKAPNGLWPIPFVLPPYVLTYGMHSDVEVL
jgi:hypothetical protein